MKFIDSQISFWAHMLDEAMQDKTLISLNEDKESKNMHKARRWIEQNHPEVIGQKLQNGITITSQKLIEEIRNTVPNVRMCDCKFLLGLTRLYFDLQSDSDIQHKFNKLNKMLKIICTAHVDEYDNDLNGLSFDELDQKFSGAVQKDLSNDKEEIDKLVLLKQSDYEIIPIKSFADAKKYGKYTSWCVTHYKDMFNSYTKNGLGRFYFCLKPGFENVKAIKKEGCPMDEYGKSMIAISVNDDGSLNTCTCRWNHDNGGDDNMMDTKQISEFFGVNFYKTFVSYTGKELLKKYEDIRIEDDDICKQMGWMRCEERDVIEDEDRIQSYVFIDQNQNIQKYQIVADNCFVANGRFCHVEDRKIINGAPQKIDGFFDCSYTKITSLEGAPQKVDNFCCSATNITSLKGAPQEVGGDFYCVHTKITSLEGAPKKVDGDFDCSDTKITTLEGVPQKVGGDFNCSDTNITSLEGAPQKVSGSFWCSNTKITSLKGVPQKIDGFFDCSGTKITSLEGAPQKIGRYFYCMDTDITPEQKNAYEEFLKHPTPEHIDATGHYKP